MSSINSSNLPALVERVGGALAQVMSDLPSRISGRALSTVEVLSISRLVDVNPTLNTESRVELLAEMVSRHGVAVSPQFKQLLEQYEPEVVFLAVAFIRESVADIVETNLNPTMDISEDQPLWLDTQVLGTCEIISILYELEGSFDDPADLDAYLAVFGSLQRALELSRDELVALWEAHASQQSPDVLESEDEFPTDESERGD